MDKNILVVEDFRSIQDVICRTLEKQGFLISRADDGAEAWEIVQKETIDLVITDFNMPNMSGMDLLKSMKSNAATAHIPVIFVTTENDIELKKEAKKHGLFAWMSKPYNFVNFLGYINHALAKQEAS
ncbi:MAG: response regulator [Bacteroidota bacterium]